MSLTAEQVRADHMLLRRNRKKNSFGYLDGTIGAILFEGRAFITTPNDSEVHEPVLGNVVPIRLKQDGRFGAEDPFQRPQPYMPVHPHLACIRRPPLHRSITQDVLFMDPQPEEHFRPSMGSKLGYMDSRLVTRLRDPSILLAKRYRDFMATRQDLTSTPTATRFNGHVTQLKIWIGRLESLKAPWQDILFAFTQAQRHYLELEAYLEYMEVRQPLMNSEEYGKILLPAAPFIGAVTNKVVVVEEFAKAGVPVWLIRPIEQFSEDTRIDIVVNPSPPENLNIEMRPWRGPKTLAWSRAADDPQRHDNLMLFGREFLAYTDFGRSSAVRDTIERPPAVPSLGNDYSAGPPQVSHPSIPPNQNQAPSTSTPKPRVNLQPHDTIHFQPNPHPMMPIMMEAWAYGLSTVEVNKDHVSPNYVEGANGFILPPPSVFIPAQSDGGLKPRQLKLLHTYITHFDILLLRLSPRNSPTTIPRGSWNLLLGPERSHLHPPTPGATPLSNENRERDAKKRKVDKQTERRLAMLTTLEKWTNEFDKETKLRNETLAWASEQLPRDRWPHDRVTERILYEVNEINFRWEFRMLDRKMLDDSYPHYAHEDLVTQCFPSTSFEGEGGSDHMSVTYLTAWRGLSNPNGIQRRKYVIALARVMAQWDQCPASIKLALDSKETDVDFLKLEQSCATYYCRSYFYYFARAPSVPHRTTIDPTIYLMP